MRIQIHTHTQEDQTNLWRMGNHFIAAAREVLHNHK